jgi:hypothetical protein
MNNLSRICPKCSSEIKYKLETFKKNADKNNSLCKRCAMKELSNRPEVKRKASERIKGENNPGYGGGIWKNRKHSDESIEKIRKSKEIPNPYFQTEEFRNKISKLTKGDNNPMRGRNCYQIWVEKFGLEEANNKMSTFKENLRISSSGKNNPMYGKISPKGSGNGWGGWYNDIYFRSLHELSFLVNMVDRFGLNIKSGELEEYSVNYIFEGSERKYFSDWIVNDKYMVEIKPKKLKKTGINLVKFEAARNYCNENNLIFKIIDPGIPSIEELNELYDKGFIKFNSKTQIKYENFLKKWRI